MSAGIDYGLGQTNVDPDTGIRFGVISVHDVLQAWADSSEPDYGEPHCPSCGNEAYSLADADGDYADDYGCDACSIKFDTADAFGDEPAGYTLDDGEYVAESCLDSDIVITKSPYYTRARFCSPCVPGAGNLNDADPEGVRTYCFGHDWFEEGVAPYPVYRVDDDTEVHPVDFAGS